MIRGCPVAFLARRPDLLRQPRPGAARSAGMFHKAWHLLTSTAEGYMARDSLSRGAAIAYYTVFSLAPVLVIVIAIAGLFFGEEAARGAIVGEIGGMMGKDGAAAIQSMIHGASSHHSGYLATGIGIVTLIVTASGVFTEMQTALNAVWQARPQVGAVSQLVRVRLMSLGLVMALGFLLLVSLVVSTALSALDAWFAGVLPGWHILMRGISLLVSLVLVAVLFGAIYKALPDRRIAWGDVAVGAVVTTILFEIGKYLIGLYLGHSATASVFGGASTLAVVLLWIYYSSQIFLFGAEFTRAYAETHGTHAPAPIAPGLSGAPTGHGELDALKAELRPARNRG